MVSVLEKERKDVEGSGDIIISKEGKKFRSKREAMIYYIKEVLDTGNVVEYLEIQRYLAARLPIEWGRDFGTILNQFIQSSDEYRRIERGRYVKRRKDRKKDIIQKEVDTFSNRSEGIKYYIVEYLKKVEVGKWSEIRNYVNKRLPSSWMGNFSVILSEMQKDEKEVKRVDRGQYQYIGEGDMGDKETYVEENVVCKRGKEFKSKSAGVRYYINELLKDNKVRRFTEIKNEVSKHVPKDWVSNYGTIIKQLVKWGDVRRVAKGKYQKSGGEAEVQRRYKYTEPSGIYTCRNGKQFSTLVEGIQYYVKKYTDKTYVIKAAELRKYVLENIPEDWKYAVANASYRYLKSKDNLKGMGRGKYINTDLGEEEVGMEESDEGVGGHEDDKTGVVVERKGAVEEVRKSKRESGGGKVVGENRSEGLDVIVEEVGKLLGETVATVDGKLAEIDITSLTREDLIRVIELKDVVIDIGKLVDGVRV